MDGWTDGRAAACNGNARRWERDEADVRRTKMLQVNGHNLRGIMKVSLSHCDTLINLPA
jgi:hypothetical protein